MDLLGDEQNLCPCHKEYQEFHKLMELKDSGLVVYCHRPRNLDVRHAEEVESARNTSKDVFIIYNKKNVTIASSEVTAELEKENISCPRCRKTFEHAQELMQEVKSICKKTVMGVCDQCRKKAQRSKEPLCVCDKIVKKFISDKDEQKEDKQNTYFDLQINRGVTSPVSMHEPEVQQMFSNTHFKLDGTELTKTNLKEGYVKQTGAFIQPIEPVKTSSAHKLVETFVGLKELPRPKDRKKEEIFEDKTSMHAKEALKRRHDLTLRQMVKPEKESEVPYPVSKKPEPYISETPFNKKEDKKAKHELNSSHLIKNTQDKFHLQAEKEKIRQEVDRQKKPALEEKRRKKAAEEKQSEVFKSQKKYEDEQKKLKGEPRKYEDEKKKLKGEPKKYEGEQKKLKGKQRKHEDEQRKLKGEQKKYEDERRKLKGEQRKHEDEQKKLKGEQRKYEDEQRKLKGEPRKYEEDQKKLADHKTISKKDLESKPVVVKEKKQKAAKKPVMPKPDPDKNLKKQLVKSQKENLARKSQAAKVRREMDRKETSKKENITPDEILVSMSKIQKTFKKGTPVKEITAKIKPKKEKQSADKPIKKKSAIVRRESLNFQKLQAAHLKVKAEALKKNKELENEAKLAKEEAERKAKADELERKSMQKERSDDNLKLDTSIEQASQVNTFNINSEIRRIHKCYHQHSGRKSPTCPLCDNSDLELEVLSLNDKKLPDNTDIIIGEKIFKYKPRLEIKEPENVPILFQKEFLVETHKTKPKQNQILLTKIDMEPDKGIVRYALSDRTFIDKGWTILPTEKVVRKMNVYRMRPAHPEFDWFEHNKKKQLMTYDTGERLAEFDDKGRGRWYYRNGRLALDYYDAEETNAQQRFVVYSSGEPDERGRTHPVTILATFDYLGNGIVFDHAGKIRLKYNQTEGVVLDRGIGPISHWQWHSLNDPPVLQQVMIDTQMAHKDPGVLKLGSAAEKKTRQQLDNEEMLAIEFDNFIKEKSRKLSQKFKPFQIRMKALKINEHFSLKVLDQATVYLIFRDGSTNLKLNIGMVLDHQEIVDTDTAEVGEVSNSLERFPARTDSLAGLQRSVAHAQRYERQHAKRERWLRPPEPCASADHLISAASPPMRLSLRTVPTGNSSCTGYCRRKPTNNLYYDTRLRS